MAQASSRHFYFRMRRASANWRSMPGGIGHGAT
jgi:hypothetical protein